MSAVAPPTRATPVLATSHTLLATSHTLLASSHTSLADTPTRARHVGELLVRTLS